MKLIVVKVMSAPLQRLHCLYGEASCSAVIALLKLSTITLASL